MAYVINANNKNYEVTDHAAKRMLGRFISEQMIIATLENGMLIQQAQGTDLYELDFTDENSGTIFTIKVVVDEENRSIVTVMYESEDAN